MKNNKILSEHLNKIKHRFDYQINESPRYRPVVEKEEFEFDDIPQVNYMTQDGMPVPNVGGSDAYIEEQGPAEKKPVEPTNASSPENVPDVNQQDQDVEATLNPESPINEPPANIEGDMVNTGDENVDQIQNDIIRHNIDAMKSIHEKLKDLESVNVQLNTQLDFLNKKVKEVEEPTDAKKLMSKKDVSYPYYFNLNDFWSGNFFQENREKSGERGIRQLPDGSYIADFDDLVLPSKQDVENSFNDMM